MNVMVPPLSQRLAQVHARIAELQSTLGTPPAVVSRGGGQFAGVLSDAVRTADEAASPADVEGVGSGSALHGALTSAPGGAAAGRRAVEIATRQLGTPYVWGAEHPAEGFDCSGLVQYTFRKLGVLLPRVSRDQASAGRPVASLADARPGDLVAFGSPVDHIGIYAGRNMMVVAPRRGDVVKMQQITRTPTAIRRVVG